MDLEKQQLAIAESLGELLKTTRNQLGLSILDVAKQLNLKQSFITALESGDYQIIGSMVYVKGYLRIYARILQLDIESEIASLKLENNPIPKATTRRAPLLSKPSKSLRWPFKIKKTGLVILLGLLLLVLLIYWFCRQPSVKPVKLMVVTTPSSSQSLALPVSATTTSVTPKSTASVKTLALQTPSESHRDQADD